ncbi:hypothetical protein HPB51_004615 [Rhipicephalus microplus]|uniref:non-specific serine/threonine protein kinase n=1 Tax=Rhipicephalus microplus TaxID=6941 RepID=A0A9J6EM05_RHIMP|nr:hypothetical protein HPB51_004615 [Rhipicephalus microplus]
MLSREQNRQPLGMNEVASAPSKMDAYQKIEVVGRGAFGVVTLYSEKSTGRKVVIKHIPVQQMSSEEKEGSLNEAKVLAMLHHPNIIAYYDSFLEEKSLAIVMEYASGGNLYDYLKQRGGALISEEQVLSYFVQVLLALEHVHSRQILHRDLKTQNLLLNQCRSIVKVGDFGISKILTSKSKAESIVGTPNNLSPEICVGKPYNQKSDVWALGCILYELLTLRSPFEGNHVPSLVMKIIRGSYEPISDHYSTQVRNLLERMLQKEPSQRPSVNQLKATPFLLPVICNIYLTTGSLPCVAQALMSVLNDLSFYQSIPPSSHVDRLHAVSEAITQCAWQYAHCLATETKVACSYLLRQNERSFYLVDTDSLVALVMVAILTVPRNKKLGFKDGTRDVREFTQVPRQLYAGHKVVYVTGNEDTTAILTGTKFVQWKHLKSGNKPEEIHPAPQLPDGVKVVALACSASIIAAVVSKGHSSNKS